LNPVLDAFLVWHSQEEDYAGQHGHLSLSADLRN
jgi:hypothetical protein